MKKLLAVFLVLVMGLAMVPAFAEEISLDKHYDIDLMAYFFLDVPPDDPIITYLNEKFNVTINLSLTSGTATYPDALNMRLASGQIPDWFRINQEATFGQLVEDGCLLNISQYVEKYNFENIRKTFEAPYADVLATDGVFYRIPDGVGVLRRAFYVRKDWMEALNMEMPETWDELAEMVKAFQAADLDHQGNVAGIVLCNPDYAYAFAPGWTGYNGWAIVNGERTYFKADDNYKAYLKYLNGLYNDGVLDSEGFTMTRQQSEEKFSTGRSSVYWMNANSVWWDNIVSQVKANNADADVLMLVPVPAGPKGSLVGIGVPYAASSSFNADLEEDKAARILAIMDYLLSDEGKDLTLYGFEGQHHDVVDGERVVRTEVVLNEWGQSQHLMGELADFGANDRMIKSESLKAWAEWYDDPAHSAVDYSGIMYDPDAAVIQAELREIDNRYFVPFVTGSKDIDKTWDEYIDAMNAVGLEKLGEIVEAYYEKIGKELPVIND